MGYLMFTTEFNLEQEEDYRIGNVLFDSNLIKRIFPETKFHSFSPVDLRISDHPMNIPSGQYTNDKYSAIPHITRFLKGKVSTCISLLLSKNDLGNDYLIEEKGQYLRIRKMKKIGLEMTKKLEKISNDFIIL